MTTRSPTSQPLGLGDPSERSTARTSFFCTYEQTFGLSQSTIQKAMSKNGNADETRSKAMKSTEAFDFKKRPIEEEFGGVSNHKGHFVIPALSPNMVRMLQIWL